jgi:hypothetical protein
VAHPPLAERGRMLSADDVLKMLPKKADGSPCKSRYWLLNCFLPEKRHELGRTYTSGKATSSPTSTEAESLSQRHMRPPVVYPTR